MTRTLFPPDHQLIRMTTRLFPSLLQAARFEEWARAIHTAQRTVAHTLASTAARGEGVLVMPRLSQAEIEGLLLQVCPDLPGVLPPEVWRGVASLLLSQWRPLMGRAAPVDELCRVTQGLVPLDMAVHAVGAMTVHIEGEPEAIIADLWRLPAGLTGALLATGADRQREVQADLGRWRQADREGEPRALVRLHSLACRYGPMLHGGAPGLGVQREQPHRARHATLQRVRLPGGQDTWVIEWSIRVPPAWWPAANRADVVGVDVGIRAPLTWACGSEQGQLSRGLLQTGDWRAGGTGSPVADAVVRRAQFERLSGPLDDALRQILRYTHVAIERTEWGGLQPGVREAMDLTGVTSVLAWLVRLGRLSGTRVLPIAPEGTSVHCASCGQEGRLSGSLFLCPQCPPADRDFNAARYMRRVVVGG